jgi:hypothetical protein
VSIPGLRPERAGCRAGWMLAGLALVLTGLAGAASVVSGRSAIPAGTGLSTTVPR